MTTITRRTTAKPVGRDRLKVVRRPWSAVIAGTALVRAKLVAMAAAGQLGPDPETEISRWTGGRV